MTYPEFRARLRLAGLKEYEVNTAKSLWASTCDGSWVRLMDIGGHSGSHHSDTVKKLIRLGLAERREWGGSIAGIRKTYRYRATQKMRER